MATKLQHYRSTTGGNVPTTGGMSVGELALNLVDKRVFTSNGTSVFDAIQHVNSNFTIFGTNSLIVGNSTVNTVANSTAIVIANSTASIALTSPTAAFISNGQYFFASDGTWKIVSTTQYHIANSLTTSTTAQQAVDAFAVATYRSAKYQIQITDNTNSDYMAAEALVLHNGTTALVTVHSELFNNTNLGTFDVDISAGNCRLLCTPKTANSTIRTIRTNIVV